MTANSGRAAFFDALRFCGAFYVMWTDDVFAVLQKNLTNKLTAYAKDSVLFHV